MRNNTILVKIVLILILQPIVLVFPAETEQNVPREISALLTAYPDFLESADNDAIYWYDGTRMEYTGFSTSTSFEDLLNTPSLIDQMSIPYHSGDDYQIPPLLNSDPGRIRYTPFFKKMYGRSKQEVKSNLTSIRWLPSYVNKKVKVTMVNGVDKALENVSDDLEHLLGKMSGYPSECLFKLSAFSWRTISGTNRLSAHSFGIAFDINHKKINGKRCSEYWKWDKKFPRYRNSVPMEIVKIFEEHGFIWGGKWYHYDTMHFEYRPELLWMNE